MYNTRVNIEEGLQRYMINLLLVGHKSIFTQVVLHNFQSTFTLNSLFYICI